MFLAPTLTVYRNHVYLASLSKSFIACIVSYAGLCKIIHIPFWLFHYWCNVNNLLKL